MSLNTTTPEADARYHSAKFDSELGTVKLVRKWPLIDATYADTLFTTMGAVTSVTNPKIDGETYSGIYNATVVKGAGEDDRSITLYQTLVKQGATNSLTIISDIDCRFTTTTTYYWDLSKAEVTTKEADFNTQESGYQKSFRVTRNNEDNTFDAVGSKRLRKVQDIAEYTSEADSSKSEATTVKLGTTDSSLLPIGAVEAGKIKVRAIQRNEDCTNDITLQVTTVTNQTTTSNDDSAARSSANILNTQADAQVAAPTATAGTIKRNSNTPTDAGKFRTTEETITVKNQTSTTYETDASKTSTADLNTEAAAALTAPVQEAGKIKRSTNAPTESGRFRTVAEVAVVADQTSASSEDNAAQSSATELHTENTAQVSGSASAGTARRITNAPTQAGKYRTSDEVVTPKDQTTTTYVKTAAAGAQDSVSVLHTQNASALSAPTPSAGEIITASNTPTEFGLTRTVQETVTVKNQTSTSYEKTVATGARDVTTVLNTENSTALSAPTPGTNEIVRATNTPTQAGKTRTVLETTTVKNQTTTAYEKTASADSAAVLNTETTETADPGTAATGTVHIIRQTPTEAGNFRVDNETITAKYQHHEVSYTDRYGTAYYAWGVNATAAEYTAAIAAAAITNTTNNSVVKNENRFGLIDYVITKSPYDDNSTRNTVPTTYDIQQFHKYKEKLSVSTDVDSNGYLWRWVTVYTSVYVGSTFQGGAALRGAVYNWKYGNTGNSPPPAALEGDSDSEEPRFIGYLGGAAIYYSKWVYRAFGVDPTGPAWQPSSTDYRAAPP